MARYFSRVAFLLILWAVTTPLAGAASENKPTWQDLNAEQQAVLAPLKEHWSDLEAKRKQKWLGIAKRYPKMRPEEQQRLQQNMLYWATLPAEQRKKARENFKKIKHVDADQKTTKWKDYQELPPETKAELRVKPSEKFKEGKSFDKKS